MNTEVISKTELLSLATENKKDVGIANELVNELKNIIINTPNIDDIDINGAATILSNSLEASIKDVDTVVTNILAYAALINEYDVNDFIDEDGTLKGNSSNSLYEDYVIITEDEKSTDIDTSSEETISKENNTQNITINTIISPSTNTESTLTNDIQSNNNSSIEIATVGNNVTWSTYSTITSSNNVENKTTNSDTDLTNEIVYKTQGLKSDDARTQRSAVNDIIIRQSDLNASDVDISKYKNNKECGFEVTRGNLSYELCEEDIELLCAIVSAESDKTYDDALAVITTILNRCEDDTWIEINGRDPIQQVTATDQFKSYQNGTYEKYMDNLAPDEVKQAVLDALAGVRNHNYCNYEYNENTEYSSNMISPTGNRYK